jgi:uncharacterized protein
MEDPLTPLWQKIIAETPGHAWFVHGPDHWARVERNGVHLARCLGLDDLIVRLFAVLHDSMRRNESGDPGHGRRAARYAESIRNALPPMDDDAFELLHFACEGHTDYRHAESEIVAICWDADRLDLGRVGMVPDPDYMNTAEAKRIAATRDYAAFDDLAVRTPPRP